MRVNLIRLTLVLLGLGGLACAAEFPDLSPKQYRDLVTAGVRMTPQDAESAEASLAATPNDLSTRTKLLAYWTAVTEKTPRDLDARSRRMRQIAWFAENAPGQTLLHDPAVRLASLRGDDLDPKLAPEVQRLRNLWQQQTGRSLADARIFENAGHCMTDAAPGDALLYYRRLRQLEPGNSVFALQLASLHARAVMAVMQRAGPGTASAPPFGAKERSELENSSDVGVVGMTGVFLYQVGRIRGEPEPYVEFGATLLRKAQALDPSNQRWSAILASPRPTSVGVVVASSINNFETAELWPGGVAPEWKIADSILRVAPEVQAAKLQQSEPPRPPAVQVTGPAVVELTALIDKEGRVAKLEPVKGPALLLTSALDAVRHWKYSPTLRDGQPTEVATRIVVRFQSPGAVLGGIIGSVPSAAPQPSAGPTSGPQRIRVGGEIQKAKVVQQPRPNYPALAKTARISGVVKLAAVIGKDGHVISVELIDGHPLLVPAAIDAVKQWVYQPTLLNGAPVEVATQVDVNFTLSQ